MDVWFPQLSSDTSRIYMPMIYQSGYISTHGTCILYISSMVAAIYI